MSSEKPSPQWLPIACAVLSISVTVGGGIWTAATRDADLRHIQQTQATLEMRLSVVESRANRTDVILERFTTELQYLRQDVSDVKRLLQGKPPMKYARDE